MKNLTMLITAIFLLTSLATAQDYSLSFDGDDDYVDIPNVNSLTDFSYLGWFKTVGINQDNASQIIINTRNGMVSFPTENSEVISARKFVTRNGTCPGYRLYGYSVVNQEQWYHFAYTATATGSKLYIDGVLVDETEESVSCQSNYSSSFIGWHGANQSSFFYGLIDEISIWSTALTQAQIQSYMTTSPTGNESGLVDYWDFNEGEGDIAYDSSPNNNDGTVYGATWVENIYGCTDSLAGNFNPEANWNDGSCTYPDNGEYSLSFDGVDDYVDLSPINLSSSDQMTLMCWINPDDLTSESENTIIRQDWGEPNWLLQISDYGTNINFNVEEINGDNFGIDYTITPSMLENSWHHATGVYDGGNLKIYIDGNLVASQSFSGGNIAFGGNDQSTYLNIGSHPFPNYDIESFDGFIDEVSIWSVALSEEQIQSYMTMQPTGIETGLAGYWKFNAGEGETLYDHSGNQNHGAINGATWSEDDDMVELTIDYQSDWDLVGLPLAVEDASYSNLFPESIVGTLYAYDVGYIPESYLTAGEGYWLRFNDAGSTTITGTTINELTISLSEGWNLVSGISETVSIYSISDPDGIIVSGTLYGFDVGYVPSDELMAGKGYWLRAYEDGEITLTSGALAKTAPRDFSLKGKANSLNVNGMDLYFGVEMSARERLSYGLPPKPPSGAFDVRFSGDTRIAGENTEIEVMNPSQTLTISYDVVLDAGDHMSWILISESDKEYTIEGSGEITIPSEETFTLERKAIIPIAYTLHQNYPNPFNPITSLRYDLPEQAQVTLTVYDLIGREVTQLVNTAQEAGYRSVQWDATDMHGKPVSAGVYLYQIRAGEFVQTKKMVLLK